MKRFLMLATAVLGIVLIQQNASAKNIRCVSKGGAGYTLTFNELGSAAVLEFVSVSGSPVAMKLVCEELSAEERPYAQGTLAVCHLPNMKYDGLFVRRYVNLASVRAMQFTGTWRGLREIEVPQGLLVCDQ